MNLYDLLEDYFVDSEDAVRTIITWLLNQVMEFEALQQSGAEKYERNDSRRAQRNGYRKRSLTTRHGTLELFVNGGLVFPNFGGIKFPLFDIKLNLPLSHIHHKISQFTGLQSQLSSILQPVTLPFDVDRSTVMQYPVKNSRCNNIILEYLTPLTI